MDFKTCTMMGNAAGAHCVMERGAISSIKSFEEIQRFMLEQRGIKDMLVTLNEMLKSAKREKYSEELNDFYRK